MRIQRAFPPSLLVAAAVVVGCDHSSSCPQWMCAAQAAHAVPSAAGSDVGRVEPTAVLDSKVILPLIAPKPAPKRTAHAHHGGGGGGRSTPSAATPEPEPPPPDRGLANGVACTFSSDCASGDCTFSVCQAKNSDSKALGNGVDCTFSSDCASGDCTFGKCQSKSSDSKALGNGVACTFSSDCASGDCTFNVCKGRDD